MHANSGSLLHLIQLLNRSAQNGTAVISVDCTKKTYNFARLLVQEGYLLRCIAYWKRGQRMLLIYLKYDSSGKAIYSSIRSFAGCSLLSQSKCDGVLGRAAIVFSVQGRFFLSRPAGQSTQSIVSVRAGLIYPVAQII